jgi:hypothetical protein
MESVIKGSVLLRAAIDRCFDSEVSDSDSLRARLYLYLKVAWALDKAMTPA